MTPITLCRLCICNCSTFKCLFDESGQINAVYEIAVKYFDPMILNPENGDKMSVICIECWQHISDFHSFQKTVIQNQSELKSIKPTVHIEKLADPTFQTPTIKDEITTTENTISVFDIVQIQNDANSLATQEKDYDMMIKDQSIILQLTSSILPVTSCEEVKVCGQREQETTEMNAETDSFTKLKCDMCNDTFSNCHMLPEHYYVKHDNAGIDTNMEIDQMVSNSSVKLSDDEAGDNNDDLLYVDQMESNRYIEISDDDQNDNTAIKIDDELNDNYEHILQQRSLDKSNHTPIESNHADPTLKLLNGFEKSQLRYDMLIAKWKPNLECPLCKSIFAKYSTYCLHFKNEHPLHKSYITCCQRIFYYRYNIVEHIALHLNPNIYKCYICESNFRRKSSLKRHFINHHTNQHTKAEIEYMFREKVLNDIHDNIINDHVYQNIINDNTWNNFSKDIISKRTSFSFVPASLQGHSKETIVPTTSGVTPQNVPSSIWQSIVNSPTGNENKFVCTQCNLSYSKKSNLQRHNKSHHKNNNILTEREHNNSFEQFNAASNQSYSPVIDENNCMLDQSNTIPHDSVNNEIETKYDEDGIVTSIAFQNAEPSYKISEAPVHVKNTVNDDVFYNEIAKPSLDIVDITDEMPLNECARNNLIENDLQSCNNHNNLERNTVVINLDNESSASSCLS